MSDPRPPDPGTPVESDIAEVGVSRTRGSVLFLIGRAISALFNLVSVPILMSLFGESPYSAIIFTLYIQNLMACFDIGITEVGTRQMSVAIAARDDDEFKNLNRDQLSINLISGSVMLFIGIACGLFVRLEESGVGRLETFVIFLGIGIQSALNRLSLSVIAPLAAYQKFDRISIALAIQGIVTTVLAVALAYLTRRPWTYAVAIVVAEAIAFLLLAYYAKQSGRWQFPRPRFRKERLRPLFLLCLADYPNRVGTFLSAAGDKLVLGAAGYRARLDAVDYRNGSRLPDVLKEMLISFGLTSLPSFSRDFHHSREKFREGVLFSGLVVFFACCLAMIVPAGFAEPLLRIWLGKFYVPDGARVMVFMAVFQALQTYIIVVGYAFFAMEKRSLLAPVTLGGAIVSVLLTLPVYRSSGIVGVAEMNLIVGGVQAIGLWLILAKLGFSTADLLRHALRIFGVMLVCLAFTAAGWWSSSTQLLQDYPVSALVFAPLASLAAMLFVLKLKLAALPDRISRRLRAFWPLSSEGHSNI